jgi:hypothetical protein
MNPFEENRHLSSLSSSRTVGQQPLNNDSTQSLQPDFTSSEAPLENKDLVLQDRTRMNTMERYNRERKVLSVILAIENERPSPHLFNLLYEWVTIS